jgi:acrylyl-CoA reductase (NADPH)
MTTNTPQQFGALVAQEGGGVALQQADSSVLHKGDVLVKVAHSCINYKDALAVTGKGKILRAFPIVPGIDYAGEVAESQNADFAVGAQVLLTGQGVGEQYSGGFAEYAGADANWLLPLPAGMSAKQAMQCGTAGLTAALCVLALTQSGHVKAGGNVAVSGASGGVGSFAVLLLARMGYAVSAVSRPAAADYLRALGAQEVVARDEMSADCRPLEKARWHGAVDCVGGKVLARLLAETKYGGVVAACGLAGGHALATTVMPFILRGVRLDGVDSVNIGKDLRQKAWGLLAERLRAEDYERIEADEVGLGGVAKACERVLAGEMSGRVVVTPGK